MSKETKFRVWDIEAKKMRHIIMNLKYALHGLIACQWCDGATLDNHWLQNDADCVGGKDRFILIEYTGFKAQGVEIYDGDIVKLCYGTPPTYDTLVIEYADDENVADISVSGWWMRNIGPNGVSGSLCKTYENDLEIIGNIHQNPELLEQAAIAKGPE